MIGKYMGIYSSKQSDLKQHAIWERRLHRKINMFVESANVTSKMVQLVKVPKSVQFRYAQSQPKSVQFVYTQSLHKSVQLGYAQIQPALH